MQRRALFESTVVAVAGLWLAACASPLARQTPATSPAVVSVPAVAPQRVVLVTIDTLRADYVGSYGAKHVKTPTLDAIAAAGVRFETAISPVPITMPAHTSLMTGLDPYRHGVHTNGKFRLADDIPTVAESFRGAGFQTAAFIGAMVLDGRYGLSRGFDKYEDRMGYRRNIRGATGAYAERTADEVVDATLDWIATADDRFFLWVHFYDPHGNYDPPRGFRPKISATPDPNAGIIEYAQAVFPPLYAGEIYFTDTELGRLLRVIDRRFPDGQTLVVVTSDHGESLGEHGELTHTLTLYDATQKVPLVMKGPGLPTGRVVEAPVRLVDVAPTLLAMAEIPPLPDTNGTDLGPWIRGERSDGLTAYVETLETQLAYGWSPVVGMRSTDTKYLRSVRPELYDLETDPHEMHDLVHERRVEADGFDADLTAELLTARPVQPNVVASSDEAALLESLGYVVRSDTRETYPPVGWVGGPDPKDAIPTFVKLLEARSRLASGDPSGARASLETVEEAGGWIAHIRAEIALALGDYADAERFAREMIAAQPDQAEGYLSLGAALEALGRSADAATAYREAAIVNPNETEAFVSLGRLAEAAGDRDAAIARYREALDSNAPHANAMFHLAALYYEDRDVVRAEEVVAGSEGIIGEPVAVARLARAQAKAGDREAALARLRLALQLHPGDADLTAAYEAIDR